VKVMMHVASRYQQVALEDIVEERERQDATFGAQNHHPAYWLAILGKQVGQFGAAVVDREWAADKERAMEKVRWEATQVAAVAVAMLESFAHDDVPTGLVTAQPAEPRQRMRALGRDDESLRYDEGPEMIGVPFDECKDPQCPDHRPTVAPSLESKRVHIVNTGISPTPPNRNPR
jgi:hypothetical protein